jgi:hypothetical protein
MLALIPLGAGTSVGFRKHKYIRGVFIYSFTLLIGDWEFHHKKAFAFSLRDTNDYIRM